MIVAVINRLIWTADEDKHTVSQDRLCATIADGLTKNPQYVRGAIAKTDAEARSILRDVLTKYLRQILGDDKFFACLDGFKFTYSDCDVDNGTFYANPSRGGGTPYTLTE